MTRTIPVTLEDVIRQSGEGWMIDLFSPPDEALHHIRKVLEKTEQCARHRLRGDAPSFSDESLVAEYENNPRKVRGFIQALGGSSTPEMLLMVWRVLQGMEIKNVAFTYERQQASEMQVTLESPYGDPEEVFTSNDIQDFALFRHVGIHTIDGRPVLSGFFPLNLSKTGRS